MTRILLSLVLCLALAPTVRAGDAATKKTIAYVQSLQTSTGGFVSMMAPNIRVQPTLRATSSAIRALHYLGADLPNKAGCVKFVESCHDASGGFKDTPSGKPDVFTTAVGLMAVTGLKMPIEKYSKGAVHFLSENAKDFEDIRIAAAGLERFEMKSPKNDEWETTVLRFLTRAGRYQGPGHARDLASAEVTRLRLGGKIQDADALVKQLQSGQLKDGGYGKKDSAAASDLETTYRVLRCFVMLKGRPNAEAMRGFVAKCRNEDGGYGAQPGQQSSVGGTYFAVIILHWLKD